MKSLILETMAGSLAVLSGLTGAFIIATDHNASTLMFVVVSVPVLLAASVLLVLRVHRHSSSLVQHMRDQLPGEIGYRLRGRRIDTLTATEMVSLLGDHVRAQQELLNTHFFDRLVEDESSCGSLDQAQNTLQLLQSELSTLQDQFDTGRLRKLQ